MFINNFTAFIANCKPIYFLGVKEMRNTILEPWGHLP